MSLTELPHETLALRSGLTRNVLIDVEHGKRGPLYEPLFDIAEVLEVAATHSLEASSRARTEGSSATLGPDPGRVSIIELRLP
jgi:transcriptional regulator with XRE-family HTH domain